jgi:hypothetical protein
MFSIERRSLAPQPALQLRITSRSAASRGARRFIIELELHAVCVEQVDAIELAVQTDFLPKSHPLLICRDTIKILAMTAGSGAGPKHFSIPNDEPIKGVCHD